MSDITPHDVHAACIEAQKIMIGNGINANLMTGINGLCFALCTCEITQPDALKIPSIIEEEGLPFTVKIQLFNGHRVAFILPVY